GYGCIFYYKNPDSCAFLCVFSEAASRQNVERDIKLTKKWLDQFYLYKVSQRKEFVANIPVLYGKDGSIPIVLDRNQFVLISKHCDNNVTKTFKYRTILAAPIGVGESIGCVFYRTSTFQKPIIRKITTSTTIQKTNKIQILCDSIMYLIFGARMVSRSCA
ncbi:MAG: hypothetical protein LBL32_03365, partial [Holosporales bacterium]|nr:hypothetical protein [Holosporales bacterium]